MTQATAPILNSTDSEVPESSGDLGYCGLFLLPAVRSESDPGRAKTPAPAARVECLEEIAHHES